MTIERNTATFDAIRHMADQLGGTRTVVVAGLDELDSIKLSNLIRTGRDFTKVTTNMKQAVVRFVRAKASEVLLKSGSIRIDAFWDVAADAVKSVVLLRFREQGNDVSLRPLTPAYRAWKLKNGLDGRIGYMTGDLYKALQNANWVVSKQ